MAARDDIGKRILETRKQTEELKAQLQSLIKTGRNIVDSGFHSVLAPSEDVVLRENVKISPNKVQIAKSFDINHSRQLKEPTTFKNPPVKVESDQKESQKKLRNYNREEAREYMKKQREKRLEQTKIQNEEKIKAELKKRKLQELHKKSKELLTKNVQARRERSKSRDRNIYSRPACDVNTKPVNPNLLYPPPSDHIQRCRKNEILENMPGHKTEEIKLSKSEKKSEKENNSPSMSARNLEHPNWKNLKSTNLFTSNNDENAKLVDTQTSAKITVLSNITIRSPKESEMFNSVQDEKNKESTKPVVVKKNNIESQTNVLKKSCPIWLQNQPAQGYPYNFINTVKRQLQFVTNSPKPSVDIGIQNSLVDSKTPCKNPEQIRTKQELKDIIQGSGSKRFDLQSFMSHKCLNLDPKKIDHLELVTNKNDSDSIHSELHTVMTESESDTSKNIPEISSESGTSLKNNAESVKRHLSNMNPAINSERLNNMKLVTHNIKSAATTIRSDTEQGAAETTKTNSNGPKCTELSPMINRTKSKVNYSFLVDEEYESDFNTDLSRSRESIISANSPTYNKQVILLSPHYVPSDNSKSRKESRKTNFSELTSSISKELHSQNIPVAKSTPKEAITEEVPARNVQNSITEHSTNIPDTLSESKESKKSKSSHLFQSLATELQPSKSENLSKSNSFLWVNTSRGSGRNHSEIEPLKKPSISLQMKEPSVAEDENKSRNMLFKNISLRSNKSETVNSTNELHLKFEAEIHLLNDFNASLQQFTAVEKALETLKTNNKLTTSKILQNQDTQTSARPKQSATDVSQVAASEDVASEVATINYSRGSVVDSVSDMTDILGGTILQLENDSVLSTGLEMSTITKSKMSENERNFDNPEVHNFAGMSLNMFEQLIKDEDARLDNLKAILKIREQVLLDRTKGELAWLEIQKKYFKETGQLHEASVIKKKQRGILVNLQKEKHEMQRMKQMQKAASVERKIVLKEKRNMIRQQLSTDNMLKIMKVNTPRERRQSGPLKVIQRHTESLRSETSVSKRSSNDQERSQEVRSITSHHSSVSRLSEISGTELSLRGVASDAESAHRLSHVKRTLLMRETALKKRKKLAEYLLKWHEKLLEEEKRITELESTANTIISQKPSASGFAADKYRFEGKQLNQLWYNLTGCEDKKFVEEKIYLMSQIALERFCKNARDYATKLIKKTSDTETKNSVSEDIPEIVETSSGKNDYPSDFDVESVLSHEEVEIVDQSISQLITNFSKIKEDISAISSEHSAEDSFHFDKTDSDIEVSVIETNKDNFEKNKSSQLISSVNTEDNTSKDKSSFCNDEASQNHMQINIQNSVVKNLNDSKEILLMLGHSEEKDVSTEDILSKLNRVISDSDEKSCRIESHLSSSEKEELSREVRNSLSTTENILSKLSRVISEVQEKRSNEVSAKDMIQTEERYEKVQTAVFSEEFPSEQARLSCVETENEEINTGAGTEDKTEEITEETPSERISVEERCAEEEASEVSEDMIELNTGEDSEELVEELSSKHNIPFVEEKGTEEKSSEDIKDLNTGEDSEELIEKRSSKNEVPSIGEKSTISEDPRDSEDPADNSKLTNISSEKVTPEHTNRTRVKSKMSEDMLEKLHTGENSKEVVLKLSSKHTIPSVEKRTMGKSEISEDTKVSEDLAETSKLTNISSEQSSPEHNNLSSEEENVETNSKIFEDVIEGVNTGEVFEELVQELSSKQTIPSVDESIKEKFKMSEDLTETFDLTNISSKKNFNVGKHLVAIKKTLSFQVIQTEDEHVDSKEKISSSSLEHNERNFHNYADISGRKISSSMTNLHLSEDIENSGKIHDNAENLTVSPDDEDLDDTEKSSESLEQLLKISKSADIEKLPFSDNSVSLNSSPEKLIEESPGKVSAQEKAKENHEGANPRIVEDKLTDEFNSEVIEEDETIPENGEEMTDISENLQLDLSYGIIDKTKHSMSNGSEPHVSKEDDNSYEEKEHDSLSSSNTNTSSSDKLGLFERDDQDKSVYSSYKSPRSESVDVKKRVSEIMADANQNSRGDKSPRMQDLYVTTYDLASPSNSPECGSPTNGRNFINSIFGSEAEEILRKQLAIEQEIKLITEQQQKENRPPRAYVREIPNKPPPPYTPPASLPPLSYPTIVPTVREIEEITQYSAKILHKAYATGNLDNISISENTLGLIAKDVTKECYKFVFDLCKDAAREHYNSQIDADEIRPSWLTPRKKSRLAMIKPLDANGLEAFLNRRLKELFQYEKSDRRENTIIKWSRKKRDHVDEILVMESQAEEKEWTSYDKEELIVMDQITDEIFNLLLKDTAETLKVCFEVS